MAGELTNFDYSILAKDEKHKLIWCEGELTRNREALATSLLEIGKTLKLAQEVLANHGDGIFISWCASRGCSKDATYRYISVYDTFGGDEKIVATLRQFDDSALYLLAKESTPAKAVAAAEKLADKGQPVTHKVAKELIAKHKENGAPAKEVVPEQPTETAAVHLGGIAKTIEHLRVKIDDVVRTVGKHDLTDEIQEHLDKALIGLKRWGKAVGK